MKRVGLILALLLALAAFTVAAEKPKDLGGNEQDSITPYHSLVFMDDAGRSCMIWYYDMDYYMFFDLVDGGYIKSFISYEYRDGVYFMFDDFFAYFIPNFLFHIIYDASTDRANGFFRYGYPVETRWFLYDRDTANNSGFCGTLTPPGPSRLPESLEVEFVPAAGLAPVTGTVQE